MNLQLMNNFSNLSFGKKTVIADCVIKDKNTGKDVKAKFCEYDCTDAEDIAEFSKRSDCPIPFRFNIALNMEQKLNDPAGNANDHFYALETESGMNAGIAHTFELEDRVDIIQIGTNKKAYSKAGKTLISHICSEIVKSGSDKMLHAWAPSPDAIPFYTHGCGFHFDKEKNLLVDPKKLDVNA